MDNIDKKKELSDRLEFPSFDGFPDIELYMDQVLGFLSRSHTSLRDDDKLSSAMVNNYIKADILPRARGKKYSREHLAYLSVIIRLKQVLSVKDTGALIKAQIAGKSDKEFFDGFRDMVRENAEVITERISSAEGELSNIAMQLAVESYLCKIASEFIIDSIVYGEPINNTPKKDEPSGR